MASCLIVSSLDKSLDALTRLLEEKKIMQVVRTKNASDARVKLSEQSFDLVLINAPLSDEFGQELTIYAAKQSMSGIVLLVKRQLVEEVSLKLNRYGIMCVGKPLDRQVFSQAISMALSTHHRIRDIQDENKRLHEEVETIKIINRAKCVLMKYLNMSETQAHHHIEKKAMDTRVSKEEVSREILKTYD